MKKMDNENKKRLSEENECTAVDENYSVQSRAVIQREEAAPLVPYQRLELNTNLNFPPSNWLFGRNSFRFINTVPSNSSEYSSFAIALQNIDQIGDVDIVSWAQNVKTLLKIPYNPTAQVSLMLHKVGNTLLIDEFDLNLLLRDTDVHWDWFRKFFFEKIYNSFKEDQKVLRPNKSRNVVINRNLLSKFLYYSLGESNGQASNSDHSIGNDKQFRVTSSYTRRGQIEPSITGTLPNDDQPSFDRHVIWNFEDIKMLIGTDLPIFEGKDNLCISLRLNEISKPINVLTGLDYWLDNLMCNVPEVAMCYHFQGLVKEYDFLKTEDLPNLSDSKFSPKEVLDVAQNILSFLKSKATKEGHTYWLFKAKDDLYVKLYDLTSLSDDPEEFYIHPNNKNTRPSNFNNPFALPVAMLCYKVADRMSSCNCSSLHAHICSLLNNTLNLLSRERYPEICCVANCLMSDAYLPNELDPQSPHLSDVSDDEECTSTPTVGTTRKKNDTKKLEIKDNKKMENIHVDSLSNPFNKATMQDQDFCDPPPLDKDLSVRCSEARCCVLNAFKCVDEKNKRTDFEKQNTFNPNDPIPMPYEPLKKSAGSNDKQETGSETDTISASQEYKLTLTVFGSNYTVSSWSDKVTILLLQKIYLICLIEAKLALQKKSCGSSLRYIRLALHSVKGIRNVLRSPKQQMNLPFDAYVLAGDTYYELAEDFVNVQHHLIEFTSIDEKYIAMKQRLDSICDADMTIIKEMPTELGECYHLSEKCFSDLISYEEKRVTSSIRMKWAVVCHNLGSYYMNKSKEICSKYNKKMEETEICYENTQIYFRKCCKVYNDTKDCSQLAWTKFNIGHFYRVCAYYHGSVYEFKKLYIKATLEYKMTLRDLEKRERNPIMWDKLNTELVKTLKSHAIALYRVFENKKMSEEDEEHTLKQIENLFNEALAICDQEIYKSNSEFQFDFLLIHTYWAKLYYIKRKNRSDENSIIFKKKAEEHYDIVLNRYEEMNMHYDCIKVILDRMKLLEGVETMGKTIWNTSVERLKILTYKCLPLLYKCKNPKERLLNNFLSNDDDTELEALKMYHENLQAVLDNMKASIGQYRRKKRKISPQLITNLCKECKNASIDVSSLCTLLERIKSNLLAYL